MEDVDVEPLSDPPRPPGVGEGRNPLVDYAGSGYGQWAIDNIRMPGDPADIRHAPVNVLGMDILDVFRGSRHVGQVSARAVLATLRPAGCPAGVHEKQRRFCRHRHWGNLAARELLHHLAKVVVATRDHRGGSGATVAQATPIQNLVDLLAVLFGDSYRNVRVCLVVEQFAAPIIAVHRDQYPAGGIRHSDSTSLAAESPKYLGMN